MEKKLKKKIELTSNDLLEYVKYNVDKIGGEKMKILEEKWGCILDFIEYKSLGLVLFIISIIGAIYSVIQNASLLSSLALCFSIMGIIIGLGITIIGTNCGGEL